MQGWGRSYRGGVGLEKVGCSGVMKGGVCHVGVGWVMLW